MPDYTELAVTSNFSFLEGASQPQELVQAAAMLGLAGIGIADRNTLAGVVRAYTAHKELTGKSREYDLNLFHRMQVGRLSTTRLICSSTHATAPAYGQLCRLLSEGKDTGEGQGRVPPTVRRFSFPSQRFSDRGRAPRQPADEKLNGAS